MFKRNYDHLPKDTYFGMYKESTRGNPNYFLTYGNGKSAARIQDHLRPNGAHRWHNYMKTPKYGYSSWRNKCSFYLFIFGFLISLIIFYLIPFSEIKLEEAAVLHYTYAKFSDLTSRRDRCGCKPTREDVKRCFMLEFDRSVSFYYYLFVFCSMKLLQPYHEGGRWIVRNIMPANCDVWFAVLQFLATVWWYENISIAGFYNCIHCNWGGNDELVKVI